MCTTKKENGGTHHERENRKSDCRDEKQTIGVEVEMNNITREQAAKLTADFSERDDIRIRHQ